MFLTEPAIKTTPPSTIKSEAKTCLKVIFSFKNIMLKIKEYKSSNWFKMAVLAGVVNFKAYSKQQNGKAEPKFAITKKGRKLFFLKSKLKLLFFIRYGTKYKNPIMLDKKTNKTPSITLMEMPPKIGAKLIISQKKNKEK